MRRNLLAALAAGLLFLGVLALVLLLPSTAPAGRPPGPPRVVVTLPPLAWPARALFDDPEIDLTLLVPPGSTAHGFELTPDQARALVRADLVVMVGLGLDDHLRRALDDHPRPWRVVVTLADAAGDPAGRDPHAWLDPVIMGRFVDRVAGAVGEVSTRVVARTQNEPPPTHPHLWPNEGTIAARADALRAEAERIDALYRERLPDLEHRVIVTHHNAYGYLARRYGIEVAAVLRPADEVEPTPGDIARAAAALRERGVPVVFSEPQWSDGVAERVAEAAGVPVLELDPLGDGDWPALMERNLDALVRGLGGAGPAASEESASP